MNPRLRDELARIKQGFDQELESMSMGRGGNGGGDGGRPSWMSRRAPPAALPEATGWSVPVEIPVRTRDGEGKATVYLSFPPESFNDAEGILGALIEEGLAVKVWTPKRDFNDRGGGGGYGGRDGYRSGGRDWDSRGGNGGRR